jgi:lipoprotein-anchoring transpeptidase ErfK/SrfK
MVINRRMWVGVLLLAAAPVASGVVWWSRSEPTDPAPMRIEVSLSARSLKVITQGEVVARFDVAVGRRGHETPTGRFYTGDIVWNPGWTPPPVNWARGRTYEPPGARSNPMQGVKIYFRAPYYFIHGTNEPGSIGEAASHGCIRMIPDDAISLARLIDNAGGGVPLIIRE